MDEAFVTILVTDAAEPARRGHVDVLRGLLADHDGREVRATDTGLMVAFASAAAAVRCAVALQRAAADLALSIGLYAGEADASDPFGRPMVVAGRLAEAAEPGQILASDAVRQVSGGSTAELFQPAGTMKLRGVEERVGTAQVRWREHDAAPTEPTPPAARTTVVIADDQRLLRAGFRVILDEEPDLQVVGEAGDGRTAVDLVRRLRPDVALMDIRMPELDGLRAAEQILADPELPTAVLMLTTFDVSEYVYEALRIGASGFLLKDAPADRLLDAVRVVAAGDALLEPSITRRLIAQFGRGPRTPEGQVPAALAGLTARELDVLRLVGRGLSNAEIAAELVLGQNTIKTHVANIRAKLGLRDRVQAVVVAYETGLVAPET